MESITKGDTIAFSFKPMKLIFTNKRYYYPLAFLIPFSMISIVLSFQGIWWKSDTTILASDNFHQFAIFNQTLRNTLHGQGSLFYTFTSGLGLNFYALSSYYLGSFLSPFVFLFDLQSMPDAIYLFTVVKFGLIGLSTYYSLKGIHAKLKEELAILLSTSLSLMSFTTSQLEISNWLDPFILIPIILLGLHRLITKNASTLYYLSLTCLFIQHYYFGYMTAIFLTLWMLTQLPRLNNKRVVTFFKFTGVSILSALSSLFMLLPTYIDLKNHGEQFTSIVNLKTEDTWYLDFFAKNIIGSFDTTKFGSIPMIYVGIVPLLLTILFFMLNHIRWKTKLSYAIFFSLVIASFYLQPLNLFWQGMHAPNMFLYRYAWVLSISIIYVAAETAVHIETFKLRQVFIAFSVLTTGFLLTYFFRQHYTFLEPLNFLLTFEFLLAYLFLFITIIAYKKQFKWHYFILLAFVMLEVGFHTHYQIQGIANEWHFPSRANYEDKLADIEQLITFTRDTNKSFYRTERLLPQTGNDSMKFQYNGISQFSSIRNRSSSSLLDKLGFRSDGTNLNLRYQNNTLIADSLFGVKYNLATSDPHKYGFKLEKIENDINLYKNTFNQELAILTEGVYKDVKLTTKTLDNQTSLLNQLTGLSQKYFYRLSTTNSKYTSNFGNRTTVNSAENDSTAKASYTINIPADSQLYVSLPHLTFSNEQHKRIIITVNNQSSEFTIDNSFSFFNVGYFLTDTEVQIDIYFPENKQVSYDEAQFYRLDIPAFQNAAQVLKEKQVTAYTDGNQVIVDFQTEKDASLFLTIPYDKGWTATIDGQDVPIKKVQHALMAVNVQAGQKQVRLKFVPQGFYIDLIISISTALFFLTFQFHRYHKRQ